jgi:hypothetical protein
MRAIVYVNAAVDGHHVADARIFHVLPRPIQEAHESMRNPGLG